VKIYPYQMLLGRGRTGKAEVRVQNYRSTSMKVEVAPVCPGQWRLEPEVLKFECRQRNRPEGLYDRRAGRMGSAFAALRHCGGRNE